MIKGVTHVHLRPIWYHLEHSDIPYSPQTSFLVWTFFVASYSKTALAFLFFVMLSCLTWLGKYFKASYEWPFLCTLSIKVAPAYSTYIDLAAKDYVATTQVFCFSASILRESDWCVLLAGSTYSILFLRSNANSPKWIYTVGLWVVAKQPHSLLVLLLYTYLAYIALYIIPICTFREYVSTRRS